MPAAGFLFLAAHAVLGELVKHGKAIVLGSFVVGSHDWNSESGGAATMSRPVQILVAAGAVTVIG